MSRRQPFTQNGRGEKCFYCERILMASTANSQLAATRDHVIPASRGGTRRVWCCKACNKVKGDMMPGEWLAFRQAHPEWWKLESGSNSFRRVYA